MLTKTQVYQLIGNRIWMYQYRQTKTSFPIHLTLAIEENQPDVGFFTLIFHKNGQLETPTNVGFVTEEFGRWDFDEATQNIIFVNTTSNSKSNVGLPAPLPYGDKAMAITLDTIDGESMLVNYPHLDHFVITRRTLENHPVFFIPRAAFDFTLFDTLRWLGFSIKLIDHSENLMDFLNGVYEYLALHPKVKNAIISRENRLAIKFTTDYSLAFLNSQGQARFDYFSGNRQSLMEFLIVAISANNLRLFTGND